MPAYTFKELWKWLRRNEYNAYFRRWKEAGYDPDLTPSVDRIDSDLPYTFDNIQMLTWAQNRAKTNMKITKAEIESEDVIAADREALDSDLYNDKVVEGVPF